MRLTSLKGCSASVASRSFSSLSHHKPLTVLGLESSADDTCAAVLRYDPHATTTEHGRYRLLSNVVIRQDAIHQSYGGIMPLLAAEEHMRRMPSCVAQALDDARVKLDELDGIAFTRGPGMYSNLVTCATSAKALAAVARKPLLAVHHMQAHALTPLFTESNPPTFPFLTLLVSGGHTMLVLAKDYDDFEILANCQDESIGVCFDKGARALGIHASASLGAALESFCSFDLSAESNPANPELTKAYNDGKFGRFTVPLRSSGPNRLAFSFSGLRSALDRALEKRRAAQMTEDEKRELARNFVRASIAQLEDKLRLALSLSQSQSRTTSNSDKDEGNAIRTVVASGGVASNAFLRARLRYTLDKAGRRDVRLAFPPVGLCTDNAAMIAFVGITRLLRGRIDGMDVLPKAKWPISECESDFKLNDQATG